jgi:hypothetical protein
MPTAVVRGAGRCFDWQPAAKVSMMIMRPPQQRQGRGSTRGIVGNRGRGRLGRFRARRHAEQLARPCDVGGAIAVGEQSVVADAVSAFLWFAVVR